MNELFGSDLPHLVAQHGFWIVGLLVALESMGLPLPGETALIVAAIYAGSAHHAGILGILAAAAAGAIIGDNIGYGIGRGLGYRLLARHGARIGLTVRKIKLGQYLFLRHGGKVVFFGRFIAVLRALAALLAGINHMPWPRFLLFNAAGGIVWAGLYGGGAYLLGHQIDRIAGPVGLVLAVAAVLVIIVAIVLARRHMAALEDAAERALPGKLPER
ncbi:MAG TPA: DedA family protein [Acetobacteraceae bacterium]|nr:DedA family protein [Acetobacteraceae bacterium]